MILWTGQKCWSVLKASIGNDTVLRVSDELVVTVTRKSHKVKSSKVLVRIMCDEFLSHNQPETEMWLCAAADGMECSVVVCSGFF